MQLPPELAELERARQILLLGAAGLAIVVVLAALVFVLWSNRRKE